MFLAWIAYTFIYFNDKNSDTLNTFIYCMQKTRFLFSKQSRKISNHSLKKGVVLIISRPTVGCDV